MTQKLKSMAIPVLAAAIVATAGVGVTVAATTSKGLKACETSKGVLVVATSKGSCPKHDKKVTIGARGATGPSDGYLAVALPLIQIHRPLAHPSISAPPTTITSMTLPRGSYVLNGVVDVVSDDNAAADEVSCDFLNGKPASQAFEATLPAAPPDGGTRATVGLNGALTLQAKATITMSCVETSHESATGSMTAIKVATLKQTADTTPQ